ncbi:kyphoscoliosis peptidase [Trichoderma arundinaceum]|uniref:Kyphoscoliosis peptidase n=1 Tax=Trichoderma arundinaceum TaxID=490622 RepID=A0A395N7A7_TRIAR|nr:kyphoscoliosis peptidase [Trichoderma arundinaceum]
MADTEEPQFNTLAERIAALNKQKNFSSVGTPEAARKKGPPPPPPGRPAVEAQGRSQTAPVVTVNGSTHATAPQAPPRPGRTNAEAPPPLPRRSTHNVADASSPPPLPSRTGSFQASPALPPRRPSTITVPKPLGRRNSASSEASMQSTVSSLSLTKTISSTTSNGSNGTIVHKVPPACDMASLPPLPPTRRELEAKAKEEAAAREAAARQVPKRASVSQPVATPNLPPRLPSRPARPQASASTEAVPRSAPKPAPVTVQIRGFGSRTEPPRMPARPKIDAAADDAPPPVPMASRPSVAQIQAISSRTPPAPVVSNDCWVCRDWSGPDGVAAQYPKERLPRNDPVGYLARNLCDPFPSYNDKARAIFTWFHHNISYDTQAFFSGNIKGRSPEETIFYGAAVCQGYADTYKAIANRAGLECVVVGGHGKGYGYTPLKKGETPPPANATGHAWNAVRVDGGVWRLLDACWGAGHICGDNNLFKKEFSPVQFTNSSERFGNTHFPSDGRHQFRNDGRTITWEEYMIGRSQGPPVEVFGNCGQEGVAEDTIEPASKQISVNSGQVVRFQFSKLCEHWKSDSHGLGKPPLFLLQIHGVDGRKDDIIPIETDGYWHWADVNARDLGAPGQSIMVLQLTSIDGQDARGVTVREFLSKKGRCGMAWAYVARWDLV